MPEPQRAILLALKAAIDATLGAIPGLSEGVRRALIGAQRALAREIYKAVE
jgi:hypothetical protein